MKKQYIHNSMTKKKEEFVPHNPGMVNMYCCGPTVYGLLHVGNFRGAVVYNMVRNWLEKTGYKVKYVYNFTDVDDKIIARANEEGVTATEIAERYIAEFKKDYSRLRLRPHDVNPKVSEYMNSIKQMVGELISKGKAYQVGGDVWYSVESFSEYGKLSHRKVEDLMTGTRVESHESKKSAADFALWKSAKPGEPAWESEWGQGRPGWHIECSAMARSILGDQIDIHGGGLDLVFPHHENEIAQSEGCSGKEFVKYWMHNNMIEMGGTKMSKSLGNIRAGREFMDQYHPEILKFVLIAPHYRSVSDLSDSSVENSISGLARVYSAIALAKSVVDIAASASSPILPKLDAEFAKLIDENWQKIEEAFYDDFATPEAFARIFDSVRAFNSQVRPGVKPNPKTVFIAEKFLSLISQFSQITAVFSEDADQFLTFLDDLLLAKKNLKRADVQKLVDERWQARLAKNFSESDRLRDQLIQMGIQISDTPTGSLWEVAK